MNANLYTSPLQTRARQSGDTQLIVRPSRLRYAEQMERCHQRSYGYSAATASSEDLTAEKFRQHLAIFPEGQFMVLDATTDIVVGTSTNMLLNLDLNLHSPKSWAELTNDG